MKSSVTAVILHVNKIPKLRVLKDKFNKLRPLMDYSFMKACLALAISTIWSIWTIFKKLSSKFNVTPKSSDHKRRSSADMIP
jgi:hypothetical protein